MQGGRSECGDVIVRVNGSFLQIASVVSVKWDVISSPKMIKMGGRDIGDLRKEKKVSNSKRLGK